MSVNPDEAADVISEQLDLVRWAVLNTTKLLLDDNTIPFIARYRKEKTNNMPVDTLREIKTCLDDFKSLKARVESVTKSIEKVGKMTTEIRRSLHAARNINEVEHLYAPFKSGSKRTLAERARELGLEPLALQVMQGQRVNLASAVAAGKDGLSSIADVKKGVVHIIADVIAKDKDALDEIRTLCRRAHITIESSKARSANKTEKPGKAENKKASKPGKPEKKVDADKFENYFQFSIPVTRIKPHQVLAINRGESLKVLSVKLNIPDYVKQRFLDHCLRRWPGPHGNGECRQLVQEAVEDGYKRLLEPLMVRQFRSELNKSAEKASVEVFGRNLKRLLLTPPVKGKVILGLDPGFRNGCKYAITSATGTILDTGIVNLHCGNKSREMDQLKRIIHKFGCETVAIGNGTACRETETVLSGMIKSSAFRPLKVMYCIVSESGASIYSASEAAQKELPDMDVSLRGAVSIARRLQDPLSELVKIEPKHIGVGMYQHDVSESQLQTSLDGVVEECVSFVGVDINVAGETLLRRVAGLNAARAKKIIEWRESHGGIRNRQQLLAVKGLGPKSYEQCAGFIRIMPESMTRSDECAAAEAPAAESSQGRKRKLGTTSKSGSKKAKLDVSDTCNPLDMTCIHPESYDNAHKFLRLFNGNTSDIGKPDFIQQVKQFASKKGVCSLSADLAVPEPTLQLIVDGLSQPIGHDIREEFEKPLFKQGVSSLSDLKPGELLTGRVTNTTHFGAFVDAGVGRDGLVHSSRITPALLNGKKTLELGDRVEVIVENVDVQRGRLGLKLHRLC